LGADPSTGTAGEGPIRITEVRVSLRDDRKLRAFVSVTFENCFVVRGIKVIQGQRNTFVAMPSRRRADGTYVDIAHPVNNEAREWIEGVILSEYRRELGGARAGAEG
jgi:stage V sporulation protein G